MQRCRGKFVLSCMDDWLLDHLIRYRGGAVRNQGREKVEGRGQLCGGEKSGGDRQGSDIVWGVKGN